MILGSVSADWHSNNPLFHAADPEQTSTRVWYCHENIYCLTGYAAEKNFDSLRSGILGGE